MEFQRHDCPNCGAHLEIDPGLVSANCEYCGQLFHIQAAAGSSSTRACLSCGFNNASDARYCNDCGQSLGGSDRLPQMTITVEAPPPQASQRKTCPFCKEDIAAAAIKCKHCDEYLDGRRRPAQGAPRLSTGEIAREWAQRFFQDCPYTLAQLKPWSAYTPDQVKKIAGALRLQAGENGLVVLNETFWGSGKRGVVLTDQRVVWRIGKAKGDVSLSFLNRADHQYGWFKPKKLWLNKHELDPTYATKADLEALCELLQRIITDRRNRGVSDGPQRQAQHANWGLAMFQRLTAPAQSGGARGGSFGLGCLLMFGCCCLMPAAFNKSSKERAKKAQQRAQRQAKRDASKHLRRAQDAAKRDQPVEAWRLADAAHEEFSKARKAHTKYAREARELRAAQGAKAVGVLLERGRKAVEAGKFGAALKDLREAERAHEHATKGKQTPPVPLKEVTAAIRAAELAPLRAALSQLEALRGSQDWAKLEHEAQALRRKLDMARRRLKDPGAFRRRLEAKLKELQTEAESHAANDPARLRGPRPKTGLRGGVRATEPELSRRYPGARPVRWSRLVGVGPHWVVDVELRIGRRRRRRTQQVRVWIQQGKVTDVRELEPGMFGKLQDSR